MDLICPTCQKRLTIEDRYAGMVVKCPLCSAMLQAPVLPPSSPAPIAPVPAPPPVSPPASAPATMPEFPGVPPTPAAPAAPPPPAPPVLDGAEVVPAPVEAPVTRLGEYGRSWRCHIRPDIVEWIAPSCVVAIFVLSLFAWYYHEAYALNLWELAFTARGHSIYTFYTVVFMFLALPATTIVLIFEKGWVPLPEAVRPYWRFRALAVGGALALPLVFFLCDYIQFQFLPFGMQASIPMKLAVRLHLLAVASCAVQFWLETRRGWNAPLPRITIRW